MDAYFERLWTRAATIDEVLSGEFRVATGQKDAADTAALRLAAWCRSCASGDWDLFARRLTRDGWAISDVLARFAAVEPVGAPPGWLVDAVWIDEALRSEMPDSGPEPAAFARELAPVADAALSRLRTAVGDAARVVGASALDELRAGLLAALSRLAAPALYQRLDAQRTESGSDGCYARFGVELRAGGWRALFDETPVLLRLLASVTRQWIEATAEFVIRLHADLADVRRELCGGAEPAPVVSMLPDQSDPHHFGRSVCILGFGDGTRVVYKPKDLRVDAECAGLVHELNRAAPITLRPATVLARDGYGWTEFVAHAGCADDSGPARYFVRAGAWLALLHCLVSVDMHQENVIAAADHPVPIDLEMILQAPDVRRAATEGAAHAAATSLVLDSVLTVGLLPAYGKYSAGRVFAIGGVTSNTAPRTALGWTAPNTDEMRPCRVDSPTTTTNLPHRSGSYARLGDHVSDFTSGFTEYLAFLAELPSGQLLDRFSNLPIRTVLRPTRFYYMLLNRMRNHRAMTDGITWSAQADFVARLADWEHTDPAWPLHRAERSAIVDLNVPHFTEEADVGRAAARHAALDADERAWQVEVIDQNTGALRRTTAQTSLSRVLPHAEDGDAATFAAAADEAADTLARTAIRRDDGAAWVALDWVGDSEVSQLVVLGPDLYNGTGGIALFLAAHATTRGDERSELLARAAVAPVRAALNGPYPARVARSLGLGGALGIASVGYALAVLGDLLDDLALVSDAVVAATLITDEVVAADRQLDVLSGVAGAVLCLLRLHRQTGAAVVLDRAMACGRHLLAAARVGEVGRRTWATTAFGRPMTGMSHGAAGYSYALAMLGDATGQDVFSAAARECIAFESTTYDAGTSDWADLRPSSDGRDGSPSKWCYGAPGIGLARAATIRHAPLDVETGLADVGRAVDAATRHWPVATDTLCCGTLGTVELLWEAGLVLHRPELGVDACRALRAVLDAASVGADYRWSNGTSRFNLGLFRGIAGVGYTALRRIDPGLPNVLVWE